METASQIAKYASTKTNAGRSGNDQEEHAGGRGSVEERPRRVRPLVPGEVRPRDPELPRRAPADDREREQAEKIVAKAGYRQGDRRAHYGIGYLEHTQPDLCVNPNMPKTEWTPEQLAKI